MFGTDGLMDSVEELGVRGCSLRDLRFVRWLSIVQDARGTKRRIHLDRLSDKKGQQVGESSFLHPRSAGHPPVCRDPCSGQSETISQLTLLNRLVRWWDGRGNRSGRRITQTRDPGERLLLEVPLKQEVSLK